VQLITTALGLMAIAGFALLMFVASMKDVTSFTIPNWISLALGGIFLCVGWWALPLSEFALHLGVGLGALVLGVLLFAFRWVGGGDAKLFAAGALWMGFENLSEFLIWTGLFGGALTLILMLVRAVPMLPVHVLSLPWVGELLDREKDVPYGVAIAAGAIYVLPTSSIFHSLI
jgi:prepilin peptidase CpaA